MAPGQVINGFEQGSKPEIGSEVLASKVNGEVFGCSNTGGENRFGAEILLGHCKIDEEDDSEPGILECGRNGGDTTECSSSFGDTESRCDDDFKLSSSDAEVESRFRGENGTSAALDEANRGFRVMRKKKLTDDWKNYISSMRWRCHWLELKIKALLSQASKYDRYLRECMRRKQMKYGQVELGNSTSRSVPLSCHSHKQRAKKRRKRNKAEETVDIPSYMLNHILFSYYEKKRSKLDSDCMDDDHGSLRVAKEESDINSGDEFGGEWPMLEFRDGDNSLEHIFQSIEVLQSRILKVKTQINTLLSSNAGKLAGHETGNLVMSESVVSSYEDPRLHDLIDSMTGLPASGVSLGLNQIQNQASEEGLQNYEKASPSVEKPCEGEEEERESDNPVVSAPDQSILRFCLLSDFHIPKKKRKQRGHGGDDD